MLEYFSFTIPSFTLQEKNKPNPFAKAELNLLAQLIGSMDQSESTSKTEFRLNLFNTDEEEE